MPNFRIQISICTCMILRRAWCRQQQMQQHKHPPGPPDPHHITELIIQMKEIRPSISRSVLRRHRACLYSCAAVVSHGCFPHSVASPNERASFGLTREGLEPGGGLRQAGAWRTSASEGVALLEAVRRVRRPTCEAGKKAGRNAFACLPAADKRQQSAKAFDVL